MLDIQNFIDYMLEAENLTDELEDEDAKTLINWGIDKITGLINGIDDQDDAYEHVSSLMRVMRRLNRICGNPADVNPEDLTDLLDRCNIAFGSSRSVTESDMETAVVQIAGVSSGEALQFLFQWIKTEQS
jgi:hypothetical protein